MTPGKEPLPVTPGAPSRLPPMPPRMEALCLRKCAGHGGAVLISRDSYYDDDGAHLCSPHPAQPALNTRQASCHVLLAYPTRQAAVPVCFLNETTEVWEG